jgi:hypothetical protein
MLTLSLLYYSAHQQQQLERLKEQLARQVRQYLYFCTSKASKLSTSSSNWSASKSSSRARYVSICTFVPVKQVN